MIFMKKIYIQLFILVIGISLSIAGFLGVKKYFDKKYLSRDNEYNLVYNIMSDKTNSPNVIDNSEEGTTIPIETTTTTTTTTTTIRTTTITTTKVEDLEIKPSTNVSSEIIDDNSVVFDGLTLTELSNKLNKNLSSTLTDTGIYFANYTKKTGLDPYLAVAIVLHETGCKWTCSSLVRNNYNIGGLKSGGKFIKYNSLEEGIDGYLNILYNNYYSKGLNTAELMQSKYAPSSTTWTEKINWYINKIKES